MNTTGRSDSSALVQALARLPSRRRRWPDSRPGARVGVTYTRWTNAQPLDIHAPPISNACTDLQRTYPTLTPVGRRRRWSPTLTPVGRRRRCSPTLPPRRRRWSPTPAPAHALELCAHVGQTHSRWRSTPRRSPTHVPISNARTQLSRLWAGDARIHTREAQTTEVSRSPTLHASERGRQVIEDC